WDASLVLLRDWPDAPAGGAGDPRQVTSTSAVSSVLAAGTSRPSGLGRRLGHGGGGLESGVHRGGLEVEGSETADPVVVQPVLPAGAKPAEAVSDAPAQVDRRRFGLVASRAGHLADSGTRGNGLGDDLVVEDEIIGVAFERQARHQRAAERPQAGVIFG